MLEAYIKSIETQYASFLLTQQSFFCYGTSLEFLTGCKNAS